MTGTAEMKLSIELLGYRLEVHPIAAGDTGDDATYNEWAPDTTSALIELDGQDDAGELRHDPLRRSRPEVGF